MSTNTLAALYAVVESRKSAAPGESYTAKLYAQGEDEVLKKVGEEAIEIIVAAKGQGNERIVSEMADLIYHSMVLLALHGISWSEVEDELARRMR